MGCDIHQQNILYNNSTGEWKIEGEKSQDGADADAVFDVIPELVPYRWYAMFGVLAGVREEDWQIPERYCCPGIPEEAGEDFKKAYEHDYHSAIWYFIPDLIGGLKKTIKKMDDYMRVSSLKSPEYIKYERDEDEGLRDMVFNLCEKLEDAIDPEKNEKIKQFDVSKSKIFFYFDS